MTRLLSLFIALVAFAAAVEGATFDEVFGSAGVTAVSGNGGLTVGVDASGRVVSCQWPGPGRFDQVTCLTASDRDVPPLWHGLHWGVSMRGETRWLSEGGSSLEQRRMAQGVPVIITAKSIGEDGVLARQTLFVHPHLDVLVTRLEVEGPEPTSALHFFANFTPCTRLIPELPLADWALDAFNDFAVFADADAGIVTHFRPAAPSRRDWERARELAARDAGPDAWQGFRDGTWIAYAAANPPSAVILGDETALGDDAGLKFPENDVGRGGATGQCYSAVTLTPEPLGAGWCATVFVAFGPNAAETRRLLADARRQGYNTLRDQTAASWSARLARTRAAESLSTDRAAALHDALATLLMAADRTHGAIVRAPVTQPPLALDWPRHGAWINLALDTAGFPETVERHLWFLAGTIRRTPAPGRPIGSLPAACYGDGTEAAPRAVLDADAAAWFAASVWRHGMLVGPAERTAFFESLWPDVTLCADFLARWSRGPFGEPPPTFDPAILRDRASLESLLAFYLGIESAAHMAADIDAPLPAPWEQQQRQLQSAIQLRPEPHRPRLGRIEAVLPAEHWLRKPMRLGGVSCTPLSDQTTGIPEPAPEAGLDALDAAFTVLRLIGTDPRTGR